MTEWASFLIRKELLQCPLHHSITFQSLQQSIPRVAWWCIQVLHFIMTLDSVCYIECLYVSAVGTSPVTVMLSHNSLYL